MIDMMIEPSGPSGTPEADDEEEEKVLRTTVPASYRRALHVRKMQTGDTIKEIVREALEEHLELPNQGGTASNDQSPAQATG